MAKNKTKPILLCVDDEPRDLELQRSTFEEYGFHVLTAESVEHLLESMRSNRIDLILLDYKLNFGSAVDVAIEIRKMSPRMPIVLLSGYLYDIPEYFKRAVDGYLSKNEVPEAWVAELLRHFEPGMTAFA